MDYFSLPYLIPSTVVLAALAFFTRFFGKVIVDQKPFADDRKWDIEINGVMFIILLSQGIVGIAAATYGPHLPSEMWEHTIDTIFVVLILIPTFFANAALSQKFFRIGVGGMQKVPGDQKVNFDFFYNIGMRFPLAVVVIFLCYFGTNEYLSRNIFWIILVWPMIFYVFILLASIYSIRKVIDRVGVNIYFIDDSRAPLKNVIILKYNEDNIRLRDEDTIVFLNKDQVLKMEMVIQDKYLLPAK